MRQAFPTDDLAQPWAHGLPLGLRVGAVRSGVAREGLDLGYLACELGTSVAAWCTRNASRPAALERNAALLPSRAIAGLVVHRGNANALTGDEGRDANEAVAAALARATGLDPAHVLTGGLGPVAVPLPVELVEVACPALVASLDDDPRRLAQVFGADDGSAACADASLTIGTQTVRVLGMAGAPAFATVVTDAGLAPERLDALLRRAASTTFDALAVHAAGSVGDMVVAFATGRSANVEPEDEDALLEALESVLRALARTLAMQADGATRLLEVEVCGAPNTAIARSVARGVCRDEAVRAATFAARASWEHVVAVAGEVLGEHDLALDLAKLRIAAQDIALFEGRPVRTARSGELGVSLQRPEVRWSIDLGQGEERFVAYGCDLGFERLRLATQGSPLQARAGGLVRRPTMTGYAPRLKHQLLAEGLAYVRRFTGLKLLVHVAPTLARTPELFASLGLDLELCLDAGLKPLVVVPSPNDAEQLLAHMTRGYAVANVTGDPLAIVNALDRGHLCVLVRPDPAPHPLVELALKLGIGKLVTMINDEGLRDDRGLVSRLAPDTLLMGLERGRFDAADVDALVLARHAATRGVPALHVIDGRVPHVLVGELFTDEGVGTLVTRLALP